MQETVSSAFEKETIKRAQQGDPDAALLALQMAVENIEAHLVDTEEANVWISENIGPDRRYIQQRRKRYDARYNDYGAERLMEARSLDDLLDLSGSLREKVAGVLPQT